MQVTRRGVFETNSSTTHSLILFNSIKACGIELDNSKEVTITLIPLYDDKYTPDKRVATLNHVSYMVDYIYTMLMYNKNEKEFAGKAEKLIDKMQQYLVELGYKVTYKEPLNETQADFGYSNDNSSIYIEYNDGTDLEYIDDFEDILYSKESFNDYLTNYTWVINYRG